MIVCKFINFRPNWAPSSLVYLIGFSGFKLDELELGMAYRVFAPVNDKCELLENSIVGNVIIKHIAGDLLGVEDESGEMWSMVKIVTTDNIAVECKKSGEKEICIIPSGQTVKDEPKENKTTADFLKSLGYKVVPADDESKDTDRDTKEFLDRIARKYESDKAYEDFCRRFNCNPDESDDSDEVVEDETEDETEDRGPEENESTVAADLTTSQLIDIVIHRLCHRVNDEADESDDSDEDNDSEEVDDNHEDDSNLLTKISDEEATSDEPTDTPKLNKWQVDVLLKMQSLASLAQWGRPPVIMPDYTQLNQDDFENEFNQLMAILSKRYPAGVYGAMGMGPNRVVRGPRQIENKLLSESVNAVKQKSDSNRWGTSQKIEIIFDRMVSFNEVIQFLNDYTSWDPSTPEFKSLKVLGRTCKFTINSKSVNPLITRNPGCAFVAGGPQEVMEDKITGDFRPSPYIHGAGARKEAILGNINDDPDAHYSSCDDDDEDDDD